MLYFNCDQEWAKWCSLSIRDLYGQKLIIRDIGFHTRLIFEQACMIADIMPLHPIEINNWDAFREAVAHGLGIGVVGDRGLVPDLGCTDFRSVTPIFTWTSSWLV